MFIRLRYEKGYIDYLVGKSYFMAATVERFDQVAVGGTSCPSEVIGIGAYFLLFLLSLQTCQLLSSWQIITSIYGGCILLLLLVIH